MALQLWHVYLISAQVVMTDGITRTVIYITSLQESAKPGSWPAAQAAGHRLVLPLLQFANCSIMQCMPGAQMTRTAMTDYCTQSHACNLHSAFIAG